MKFFHQNFDKQVSVYRYYTLLFEPHLHSAVEIIAMHHGNCTAIIDGNEYHITKGDFLVVFPNQIHSYINETDVNASGMIFDIEVFPELKAVFKNKKLKNPVIEAELLANSGLCEFAEEICEKYSSASAVIKKGYILLLAGRLSEYFVTEDSKEITGDIINEIFTFCRANYRSHISLSSVAKALHISVGYLSHIFSEKLNINFCDYINILRTNDAVTLLSQTDKSMTEIAEISGFPTIRTFNRAFFKHTGMTPSAFKKSIK